MNTSQSKPAEKNKAFKPSGDWAGQSKRLREEYPQLTEADLRLETGKENDLLNRISTRLNKNREDVISMLKKGQREHEEHEVKV